MVLFLGLLGVSQFFQVKNWLENELVGPKH
jgi:hypothetical protein